MEILKENDYLTLIALRDAEALLVEWKRPLNSEEFREGTTLAQEVFKAEGFSYSISDVRSQNNSVSAFCILYGESLFEALFGR